jgi:hypothetical protein
MQKPAGREPAVLPFLVLMHPKVISRSVVSLIMCTGGA